MLAPLTQSEPVRWRVKCPKARELLRVKIMNRRARNKMARSRDFRNYNEMSEDYE